MSVIKVLRIEQKHGKSLAEILKQLADDGYSIRQMAKETTFAPAVVAEMLQEIGLNRDSYRVTPAREAAGKKTGKANTKYMAELNGKRGSVSGLCREHGIPEMRVYRAIWAGMKPTEAIVLAYQNCGG